MNIFKFSQSDITNSEKQFYKPFRLEIPNTDLHEIENFVSFCKNIATLLSFDIKTFNDGLFDYLEQIGYFDEDKGIYTPETGPKKDFIDDIITRLGKEQVRKIIKEVEKTPCMCGEDGCYEDKNSSCIDE